MANCDRAQQGLLVTSPFTTYSCTSAFGGTDAAASWTDLKSLREGEHVTVFARIESIDTRRMRNRRGTITEVIVTDGQSAQSDVLPPPVWDQDFQRVQSAFAGKVLATEGTLRLTHPECTILDDTELDPMP